MEPVTVNLNVTVEASGELVVMKEGIIAPLNVIVAHVTLPVTFLYDPSGISNNGVENSLIEFWEPSGSPGYISASLSGKDNIIASMGRNYSTMVKKLVRGLQYVLEGEFDCSGATPFNNTKYLSNSHYYTHDNFGRVALSSYLHYLFGHVAATAAVTNDQSFIDSMLSRINGSYIFNNIEDINLSTNLNGSVSNANLAVRIVNDIISKNDEGLIDIVTQVLSQDSSRAMGSDNNEIAPDYRQALRFYEGDVIFINIFLKPPTIVINGVAEQQFTIPEDSLNELNYSIKITLENKI